MMADAPEIPEDWTEPERWVWERIAAGEPADLNARDREHDADFKDLDPGKAAGWTEQRRLRVRFLQTILTQQAYAEATPHGGVRILGALVDDAPLDLEYARLQRLFWLEQSRVLVDVKGRNLRIDGALSLEASFVAGGIDLRQSETRENLHLNLGKFHSDVDLGAASIGTNLVMNDSTFKEKINLNGATVNGSAVLSGGSTFKGEVDLGAASISSSLDLIGSIFEKRVSLNRVTVNGAAFLSGGAIFKAEVDLTGASIGSNLEMAGSTFEERVKLYRATVNGSAFLSRGATFNAQVNLMSARIGSDLEFSDANINDEVDLGGCQIAGMFLLGSSWQPAARWEVGAALVLRNTHVGALQDWWRDESDNSWPKVLQLEGFTYDRLGSTLGDGEEADMMARPVASYLQWLGRDPSSSPQRYEQLARFFRQAGEPRKANDILYEARERRRRRTLSTVDDHGKAKKRGWLEGMGLWMLRATVGYGLGRRYFRVLWWVGGLSLLGMALLIDFGQHCLPGWPALFFASLDQLLPIITLDKAHDALIFGNASANPPIEPQRDWLRYIFYFYKVIGWGLGSFIVAGLAGLTQRN